MSLDDWITVDIALIVEMETFRTVLKSLSAGGDQWWFASDPAGAVGIGCLIVGFRNAVSSSSSHAVFFRIPLLNQGTCLPDGRYLVLAPALIDSIDPVPRVEPSQSRDSIGDFERFYFPLKNALTAQLRAAGEFNSKVSPRTEEAPTP